MPILGGESQVIFTVEEQKLKAVDRVEYKGILNGAIKNYQREVKDVNLILVQEVVDLMSSIQRKFVEGGALLMAGVSGNLRKTALKIMAHKNQLPLHTLNNIRNPTLKQFYKDLKAALEVAGGQNKKIILFFQEHQLGKSAFYEKINSLISSGEVSGLFNPDEI